MMRGRLCWLLLASVSAQEIPFVDPVSVGHVRKLDAADGPAELRTLWTKPATFLVPGLLAREEADEIVALAKKKKGWSLSQLEPAAVAMTLDETKALERGGKKALRILMQVDDNRDGKLNQAELEHLCDSIFTMPNYDAELHQQLMAKLAPGQTELPYKGKDAVKPPDLAKFLAHIFQTQPHRRNRYSDQIWLQYAKSPTLQKLLARVAAATGFELQLLTKNAEDMQIVKYNKKGHYACHYDSTPDSIDENNVRMATIAIFLSDVEAGGELTFPGRLANGSLNWGMPEWNDIEGQCQVTSNCLKLDSLAVPPKKGDAVFWYNVVPDMAKKKFDGEQVLGDDVLAWGSVHCGAEVIAGEKWLGNVWVHLPRKDGKRTDL